MVSSVGTWGTIAIIITVFAGLGFLMLIALVSAGIAADRLHFTKAGRLDVKVKEEGAKLKMEELKLHTELQKARRQLLEAPAEENPKLAEAVKVVGDGIEREQRHQRGY